MLFLRRFRLPAITAAVVTAVAPPALADTGFYLGATAGQSRFHEARSDADAAVVDVFAANGYSIFSIQPGPVCCAVFASLDERHFAFGGLLGYRFTPEFAIEAAYLDLGNFRYKSDQEVYGGIYAPVRADGDVIGKAKGPTLAALGILPLSPAWELYGRAGLFFSTVTLDTRTYEVSHAPEPNVGGHVVISAHSVDPLAGIGAAWHLAYRLTLRAEYTRFFNVGDKNKTGETNIDLFNLGVTYSFH